jgi:tripartite-type tricarboxylate transporter receptor subunit TctC
MMPSRRTFLLGLAASCVGFAARGGDFPGRPVKIIVPFPPGTPSEFVIRALADQLSARFGKAVVIENRPGGAGGTVGVAAAAAAVPDGTTLLACPPGPLDTAGALFKDLGYDPATSFAPVALLFRSPILLAVHPAVPARSLAELVAHARNHPGKLSFASPGYGTQPHLLGELLKTAAGIEIVHIPYKGPAAALTDVLAGQVQIFFATSPLLLPQAEAGKLRIVAIAAEARPSQLPDVPTTKESGFPDLTGGFWSGILAPAGTPPEIVGLLNTAINEAMQNQQVQQALARLGARSALGSPQDFLSFIGAERRKWSAVIRDANLKIN